MQVWDGHLPVTRSTLLAIFDRKTTGTIELAPADRVLYTVCEVRCAVATRNLVSRLGGDDTVGALGRARAAFEAIGAVQFVRDLNRARDELAAASTARQRRHCLAVLEDRLLCTDDPIDLLIARHAWACMRGCLRAPTNPTFVEPDT